MTLAEMSCLYRDSADAIRLRMAELRLAVRQVANVSDLFIKINIGQTFDLAD